MRSSIPPLEPAAEGTSLAEILGSFSYALDLTEGQSPGHSLRSCWIGMQIGQALHLDTAALRDLFYAVLLKDLGCSSNAAAVCAIFVGDDRRLKHDFKLIGTRPEDFGAFALGGIGIGASTEERERAIGNVLENAGSILTGLIETRCTRGADIARRLRFSEAVAEAIAHLDEHWDGSGLPYQVAGEAIPLGGRIALLAQLVDVFFVAHGAEAARAEVLSRRGSWIDPALADLFIDLSASTAFWDALAAPDIESRLFALEPAQHRVELDEDYLDDIAMAFGQVIDAKSPYTGGHSERVGVYAIEIARELGLDAAHCRRLHRAAMLHDVGKLGISSRILEKPGALDDDEWRTMQSHAALTADILGRVATMRGMAAIAGAHHERLDGKGYPQRLAAAEIAIDTRIISVADFFDALTADRPYRPAMTVDKALAVMAAEVGKAIDATCFAALQAIVARQT
ncbi:HD-GYP domain-containing protein [Novosphingobium sp. JCM 18896]|uniref:HD-GYP domain-containing protein n=1 Tax=Novosphingobium sp. JCM 18896 TaxID=2989731 RepID=UPI00222139DF|nr:HD-GYP domain-containing protein [Novosphingobium sp. JCM 18896]MCW1427824.1 HD domain-containing protein [Novosphingobium sp. JCM 18896]